MDNQQTELSTNNVFNLPEIYTETNYLNAGKRLAKAGQFLNWQIGRWYNSLEWGDRRDICEKVGINYVSAKDCGSIEKKIKMSMRNDNLTFQHHKVIAIDALDDTQRTALLQQAEDNNMSSKQLTTARDILWLFRF